MLVRDDVLRHVDSKNRLSSGNLQEPSFSGQSSQTLVTNNPESLSATNVEVFLF